MQSAATTIITILTIAVLDVELLCNDMLVRYIRCSIIDIYIYIYIYNYYYYYYLLTPPFPFAKTSLLNHAVSWNIQERSDFVILRVPVQIFSSSATSLLFHRSRSQSAPTCFQSIDHVFTALSLIYRSVAYIS